MAYHMGRTYSAAGVSINAPKPAEILQLSPSADVAADVEPALMRAQADENVYYFSVYNQQALVGAIYLHDINLQSGDALIGYHLFHVQDRGKGIGTKMLGLLQQYVIDETEIKRLIIITGYNNDASRGIAHKCGFNDMGGAWEDPENLVVYGWPVTRA